MKISIITVCYNSAATIAETLASVAAQTWPDIEYIVIDGASKDGTQEIIKKLGTRVSVFISEPDKGIYDAMNKGITLATGDIVGLLNADDVYAHRDVLANIVQQFATQSVDAVFGDVGYFSSQDPNKILRRFNSGRFNPNRIAWGWVPAHPALFFRKKVYDMLGVFKPEYRIAGDYEFCARAFAVNQVSYHYLPEILVHMRLGGASTSSIFATLKHNREIIRACRENGIYTNWSMILSKYPLKLLEYVLR